MLVVIKTILYERTIALWASMDFGKGLERSKPWRNSGWRRWSKDTIKIGRKVKYTRICISSYCRYITKAFTWNTYFTRDHTISPATKHEPCLSVLSSRRASLPYPVKYCSPRKMWRNFCHNASCCGHCSCSNPDDIWRVRVPQVRSKDFVFGDIKVLYSMQFHRPTWFLMYILTCFNQC